MGHPVAVGVARDFGGVAAGCLPGTGCPGNCIVTAGTVVGAEIGCGGVVAVAGPGNCTASIGWRSRRRRMHGGDEDAVSYSAVDGPPRPRRTGCTWSCWW